MDIDERIMVIREIEKRNKRIAELEKFVAAYDDYLQSLNYDDYRALFIVPSTSYAFTRLGQARQALESGEAFDSGDSEDETCQGQEEAALNESKRNDR